MAKSNKSLLKEICGTCNENYCFLMEIISKDVKYNSRLLIQLKCVEIFKFEESQRQGKDIDWSGAMALWSESGLAAKFAEVYKEELSYKEIQRLLGL